MNPAKHILLLILSVFIQLGSNQVYSQSSAPTLFETDEMIELRISGDIRSLFRDRTGKAQYFPVQLAYTDQNGKEILHELKSKTRGNFRRKTGNCIYPPIWLNFPKKDIPNGSIFEGQNKLKLVTACRGDSYVVREYVIYRLLNVLTDYSFEARLVTVVFHDSLKNKTYDPMYGILLEDEDQMAMRNNAYIEKNNLISAEELSKEEYLRMAVFEFFIGNTDWSIPYRHNIKILRSVEDSITLIPVPYDFDHSGIVYAPYANPAPELRLRSVRDRRYRGKCLSDLSVLDPILQEYVDAKSQLYEILMDARMKERDRKSLGKFIDDFYETIDDPKQKETAFLYPCLPGGTGNIVIRGMP